MHTLRVSPVIASLPQNHRPRAKSNGIATLGAILATAITVCALLSGTVGAACAASQLARPNAASRAADDQNHPTRAARLWSDGPAEDEQCVAEALDQQDECEDKDCASRVAAALVACATTERNICADAPRVEDVKQSASWARERCDAQGRGDRHCLVLMRALQERCDARYGGLRL